MPPASARPAMTRSSAALFRSHVVGAAGGGDLTPVPVHRFGRRSVPFAAQRGQQPGKVLTARAAGAQVRRDAGIALFRRAARSAVMFGRWCSGWRGNGRACSAGWVLCRAAIPTPYAGRDQPSRSAAPDAGSGLLAPFASGGRAGRLRRCVQVGGQLIDIYSMRLQVEPDGAGSAGGEAERGQLPAAAAAAAASADRSTGGR